MTYSTSSVTPGGTIYLTVYDGLGRSVRRWVGTDDVPTTGFWSPTNTAGTDLVKVSESKYNNVVDCNLTKQTEIPGGGSAKRVTNYAYDSRNRLLATKAGQGTGQVGQPTYNRVCQVATFSFSERQSKFFAHLLRLSSRIHRCLFDEATVIFSSRTPEGSPKHCPVCQSEIRVEPSTPTFDAPCPNCGCLLWFAAERSASRKQLLIDNLLQIADARFGLLSCEMRAEVESVADAEKLEQALELVVTAGSWNQVVTCLKE